MNITENEYGIVGAGVCGLWLARGLVGRGSALHVLDKARGVGGRLATRRTDHAKFDHGAQFYTLKPETTAAHRVWLEAGVTKLWFTDEGVERFAAPQGMTALTKCFARDLHVHLEQKVERLVRHDRGWTCHTEAGATFAQKTLVLTCPVPQTLELLRRSSVAHEASLEQISYGKALVVLLEDVVSPAALAGPSGYRKEPSTLIANIADQAAKGVSTNPAWTVTMSTSFSEEHFEAPAEATLDRILNELRRLDPGLSFARPQLKTWRYAQPNHAASAGFVEVAPDLFLAGDAFGGSSVNGALRSAEALLARLQKV